MLLSNGLSVRPLNLGTISLCVWGVLCVCGVAKWLRDTYVSCNKSEQWVGEKYVLCSETANTLQYHASIGCL